MTVCESLATRETDVLLQRKVMCQSVHVLPFQCLRTSKGYLSNAKIIGSSHGIHNELCIVLEYIEGM
jgi:hypothetical protein